MPQASKYTENTELQKTEIDAAGIKIHGKHGTTENRDRCHRHQNTRKTRNYRGPRSMPQASKYTENTELQRTEIDATGIKIHGKHGTTEDRDRCPSFQKREIPV
jgi:hypothetical protein